MKSVFQQALTHAAEALGVGMPDGAGDTLWHYFTAVREANERFNLTRITEPDAFAVKQIADSWALLAWLTQTGRGVTRVLDVGTGAGVPAVPLAILRPDWSVTAIDGTGKKARFVAESAQRLGIENLYALHARAEHWRSDEPFDLVVFKAVAPVARCLELGVRHVAPGGCAVLYKTAKIDEAEASAGWAAAEQLGFTEQRPFVYALPLNKETLRHSLRVFLVGGSPIPGRR